jgi:yeast amino acid transporter
MKAFRTTWLLHLTLGLLFCRLPCHDLRSFFKAHECGRVVIPIAANAYIGVEIVSVTAVEAYEPQKSLRRPARLIAWITALIYLTSVVAYYFSVSWSDTNLAKFRGRKDVADPSGKAASSTSIVVIAALNADESALADALTALLIVAVLSTANTALYVSSRTLWGLACDLDPQLSRSKNRFWRWLSKLSTTTPGRRVPGPALVVSTFAFWWIQFVRLSKSHPSQDVSFCSAQIS